MSLTIEQSNANCKASLTAAKVAVNSSKTAITAALVDAARHSVLFKCPHNVANLVSYIDEQGLYKELKAIKKFALDFTGVSLKGENPSINDDRHEKAQAICEPELERVQELGLIGYEQATGTGKEEKAKAKDTPEQKAEKRKAKALETLADIAKNNDDVDADIMRMVLEYKQSLEKVSKYNKQQAIDMHNATIGKLGATMMASINQLKDVA